MKRSASENLRRFYARFSGNDRVLVTIDADPDAIASAMAVKRLLWRKVACVTISNINVIKRPDNIAMLRLLGISLIHIDDVDLSEYNRFAMVDSQPDHNPAFPAAEPDIIIDHHPDTSAKAAFADIRPEYGANASIMTEYLKAAKIKPSTKLASGLFHAIKTDTSNFARKTSMEDVKAFQFLFQYANPHLVRKIEYADLRLDFLRYFKNALNDMRIRKGRVFVHLGNVVNPDVCVLIADFFMRVNPVSWSIVSGLYEEKLVIVFRNDGVRKNAGNVAKRSFGLLGSAGGHKSMARAEIMTDKLQAEVDAEDDRQLSGWIIDRVETFYGQTKNDKNRKQHEEPSLS
ncbi:DHH family phosphoesterase [Desulfobacterales bacterium HSG16]|nr:DHH family phosphoesterase [Desulfobacterales bacterium HSG16]